MVIQPLISVCIPTYNNAQYIGRTLDSVLSQDYQNIEVIVSDNASSDNTTQVVGSYKDQRVRYIRQSQPIVPLANWNRTIALARGEFVAIYHSDDIYHPDIVQKEVAFLQGHPEAGAVFCLDRIIDEQGRLMKDGMAFPKEFLKNQTITYVELLAALMQRSGSLFLAPTVMARREVFAKAGYFIEDDSCGSPFGCAGDAEMWLRIARHWRVGLLRERLIDRRVHQRQASKRAEDVRTRPANHLMMLDRELTMLPVGTLIPGHIWRQYEYQKFWDDTVTARNLILLGQRKLARERLQGAFRLQYLVMAILSFKNFFKMAVFMALYCASWGFFPMTIVRCLRTWHEQLYW